MKQYGARIRDKIQIKGCPFVWVVVKDGKVVGVFDSLDKAQSWKGDISKHKFNRGQTQSI